MIKKIALFFAILSPFTKFSFGQITVTNFDKKIITEAPKPIPYDSLKNYSTYTNDEQGNNYDTPQKQEQYIGLKIFLPENIEIENHNVVSIEPSQCFFSTKPSFVKMDKPIDYSGTLCDSALTFHYKPTFSYGYGDNHKAFDYRGLKFYTKNENIENKYYTIVGIIHHDSLINLRNRMNGVIDGHIDKQKKIYLDQVPDNFLYSDVFVLKEEQTGEKLYYSGHLIEFILVPYFVKQKEMFDGKTFVAVSYGDYDRTKINDSFTVKDLITNQDVIVNKLSNWKCEVTLMDYFKIGNKADGINYYQKTKKDYEITYVFRNEKNTIALVDLNSTLESNLRVTPYSSITDIGYISQEGSRKGESFVFSFILKDVYTKQEKDKQIKKAELLAKQNIEKQKILNKNRIEKENFKSYCINKFGRENGEIIAQQIVKIGMTVEMCEVAWGKPFDKSSTITSDQKVEIWSYGWKRSLYFVNGVLNRIEL